MFPTPVTDSRPAPALNITPADVVVHNARIVIGDPSRPASAVAITGGRITEVADDDAMAPYVGESTQVIDARGRRVIRGLNDTLRYAHGQERIDTGCAGDDMSAKTSRTGRGSRS
jgi:N-acetylglucosamine-6-phosphate deacetylase